MITPLDITFPQKFHFEHTVYSHGWCALAPFEVVKSPLMLARTMLLPGDRVVRVVMKGMASSGNPEITVEHTGALRAGDAAFLTKRIASMLNLGIDLTRFYKLIRNDPAYSWAVKIRAGRMLRGETMFEDIAKMMLTTNASWTLTARMNERLIAMFGTRNKRGWSAFPTADVIAASNEGTLRNEVKLGYRAPFMLEFARRCASGGFDPEALNDPALPTDDLYRTLRSIKGIGDYAASNLLKLLGRYDRLGLDSWCRAKFSEIHNDGIAVDDDTIAAMYERFGEWRGLAMWLDVTKHWYEENFVF